MLGVLDPITTIFPMGGPRNTLRRLVVEGRPVVAGLHLIGDSLCTTNPTFGRGLSLAMWGATDLLDTITQHPEDRLQQAIAVDAGIARHIVPYYDEQVAVDSSRLATLRHAILGEPRPAMSAPDRERITFTQCVRRPRMTLTSSVRSGA